MNRKILVGFLIFLLIWICLFSQINFFNRIPLWGTSANIGIVLIVGIGLLSGKLPGSLVGGIYGLLLDILFGKSIGIYFCLYAITGFASGIFSKNVSKDNKWTFVYMTAAFTIVAELFTYLIFVMIYHYPFEIFSAIWMVAKETVYNMFLARILFKVLVGVGEMINRSKNSYYLL